MAGVVLKMFNLVKEFLEAVIVALVVFFIMDASVQNFKIEGSSMFPTFQPGEYVVVNKLAYFDLDTYKLSTLIPFWGLAPKKNRSRFPEKEGPMVGDIVVFTKESDLSGKSFVKRIIGVPGDQISIIDGITYLNGDVLRESYLVSVNAYQNQEYNPLNSEEFFVMGDNRIASSDSRHWGPIGIDSVIGKVFADYALPFKIGFLEETE